MHEADQVAPRGGAREPGQRAGLGGGQARVVVREQLDDAQALAQALDQQRTVDFLVHGHHGNSVETLGTIDHRSYAIDDRSSPRGNPWEKEPALPTLHSRGGADVIRPMSTQRRQA